jgi:hypothetical protein
MAKLRDDRSNATGPNQVWAMDWMHDELFDGRRLWVLTVVNSYGTPPNGNGHQNLIAQPGTAVRSSSG